MGYQVIKQPNDLFAVFCSYTDTIIMWDASPEEVVDWFVELEAEKVRERVRGILTHVEAEEPRKAYFQFAMTWDEALESDREHGGNAHLDVAKEQRA